MNYAIEITVTDNNDDPVRTIRGHELRATTQRLIDIDVKEILNGMSFRTRNILSSLETLERYIDNFADTLAYDEEATEDRKILKLAIEELEALL